MRRLMASVVALGVALCMVAPIAWAGGKTLGSFKLKDGNGKEVTEKAFENKQVLLIVAQTACSQCRAELKDVQAAYDELKKKAEVWVILVDVNSEMGLARYNKLGFTLPVLLDPMFSLPNKAGVSATPATIILDKDGTVKYTKMGYRLGDIEKIKEKL